MPGDLPTTIAEAATALRQRTLSSLELTTELLARAKTAQDTVAAFQTFTEDEALAAARRADDELARGVDRGRLHGIPVGVKDILATVDAPTTASSRVLDATWGGGRDATVVSKLRD